MIKWRVNLKRINLISFLIICDLAISTLSFRANYPDDVIKLSRQQHVKDIIRFYGYPCEEYSLQTEDGYILEIQRMPKYGGPPILLMHGLRGSATNWIMMGPWSDLGYFLYDNGYDVWLANTRGTRFGRRHIQLQSTQSEFWNFSMHEIGLYDTANTIDMVLKKTGYKRLSYVGHSQGCAVLYILTSLKPEYNEKIKIMHSIAPAVYMTNIRSQYRTIVPIYIQNFQYPYFDKAADVSYNDLCHINIVMTGLCAKLFGTLYGPNAIGALNFTMTPVLMANFPETCSIRQIAHYYQIHKTDRFAVFDYDFNRKKRIAQPSEYPLSRVKIKNAIYYCGNDYLVDPQDVKRLITELSNVVEIVFVEECSHLDVLISTRSRNNIQQSLLKIDQRYSNEK